MLNYRMLELIERNFETFDQFGYDNNCHKSPCFCKNKDSVRKVNVL